MIHPNEQLTKYRIAYLDGNIHRNYLQFLHIKRIKIPFIEEFYIGIWRFMPNSIDTFSKGKYLHQGDCPTLFRLKYLMRKRNRKLFMSFCSPDILILYKRIEEIPNVEDAFEAKRKARAEYLEKKKQNASKSKV